MPRRYYTGNMNAERYLGNEQAMEVHDLDIEDTSATGCRIDSIIRSGKDRPFTNLVVAYCAGYRNCSTCLKSSEPSNELVSKFLGKTFELREEG